MSNSCECPQPPGGRAVCEPHQLAVCRVKDGVALTYCVSPPASLREASGTELENWVLSVITASHRSAFDSVTASERVMLKAGRFESDDGQEIVTFRLPDDFKIVEKLKRAART